MYSKIRCGVVGSINMDIILNMNKIPDVGENVVGKDYGYASGGKGANQAVGLSRLGANVRMIGKVADDENGNALLKNLTANGVDISSVAVNGSQTGLAAILIDGEGRNRIVVYEGANAEINAKEACDSINDIDLLLLQFETNEEVVIECVNKAVSSGIVTVIDCGPAKKFNLERMQGADIISPNESETFALTGIMPDNDEAALEASKILLNRSKAKYAVLKLGDRGCSVYDGEEFRVIHAYPSNVIDTTAAGDCFTAAMALEYMRSGDIFAACDFGNKAGSYAVSVMGAQNSMPTINDLRCFFEKT